MVHVRRILLALALVGCASPPTQVVVRLATDLAIPSELDSIRLELLDSDDEVVRSQDVVELDPAATGGQFVEIATFGVVPRGGDAGRRFEVRATARSGGATLFTTRARSGFVTENTIRLDLYVPASCIDVAETCLPDETCGVAGCVDPEIDPMSLPGWAEGDPVTGIDPRTAGSNELSPPGAGHAVFVVQLAADEYVAYRIELVSGATAVDLSAILDRELSTTADADRSLGLSPDGEWMSLMRFGADCPGCAARMSMRDPTQIELIRDADPWASGGSAVDEAGERVVLNDASGALLVIERNGGDWDATRMLSAAGTFYSQPRLRRDGETVLFSCDSGGVTAICEVGLDGTGFREVYRPDAGVTIGAASERPDGSLLFRLQDGGAAIYRLDDGSSTPSRLYSGDRSRRPCALPDGSAVVQVGQDSTPRLVRIDEGGSEIVSVPIPMPSGALTAYLDGCGL